MSPIWILCLVILVVGALLVAWTARNAATAVSELRDACDGLTEVRDQLGHARVEADALQAHVERTQAARSTGRSRRDRSELP